MSARILAGSVFDMLPTITPGSVDVVCTSPPYWQLRSYLSKDHPLKPMELGSEPTVQEFIANMVRVFGLVRETMADHAVCFVNVGDTYSSEGGERTYGSSDGGTGRGPANGTRVSPMRSGNLCLIPQRLAIALQDDGWIIRSVIVWHKPAPMPASVSGWLFRRHRVRMKRYEYQNMQQVRSQFTVGEIPPGSEPLPSVRTGSGASLSADGSVSDCEGEVPFQPEGKTDASGLRGEPRAKGAGQGVRENSCGEEGAIDLFQVAEGSSSDTEESCEIPKDRKRKRGGAGMGSKKNGNPRSPGEVPDSLEEIRQNACGPRPVEASPRPMEENQGGAGVVSQQGESSASAEAGPNGDSDQRGMGADSERQPGSVPLLQRPSNTANNGSRHSTNQGRASRERERGSGLSVVQLSEEGSHLDVVEFDCPGCSKCSPNGGLVLRRGSWRPTSSWEPILMLAKSSSYYADGEAVKMSSVNTRPRQFGRKSAEAHGREALTGNMAEGVEWEGNGMANPRDVQTWASEPLKEKHYAAFPTALVRFCLRAGTSLWGYCPTCGAPWARVVERVGGPPQGDHRAHTDNPRDVCGHPGSMLSGGALSSVYAEYGMPTTNTLGWRPTCRCPEQEPRPGLVLDPFAGSGRTLLTAQRMGLDAVGVELNPEYIRMSERLLREDSPLFSWTEEPDA